MVQITNRIKAFARHYVANGGIAGKAALSAGYAASSAAQYGPALLKRMDVQAEIALVRAHHAPHRQVATAGAGPSGEPPRDGDVYPPGGGPSPRPQAMSSEERLTRSWLVETLRRNAAICMGDEAVFVTGKDGKEVLVWKHGSAGANRALDLLDHQLDKLAGAPAAEEIDGRKLSDFVIAHRDKLANMRELLKAATRRREARQAEPVPA